MAEQLSGNRHTKTKSTRALVPCCTFHSNSKWVITDWIVGEAKFIKLISCPGISENCVHFPHLSNNLPSICVLWLFCTLAVRWLSQYAVELMWTFYRYQSHCVNSLQLCKALNSKPFQDLGDFYLIGTLGYTCRSVFLSLSCLSLSSFLSPHSPRLS